MRPNDGKPGLSRSYPNEFEGSVAESWTFEDGDAPRLSTLDCAEPINFRARYGRATKASVEVSSGPEAPQIVATEISVRDIFIAGLGDSIGSGEGNPDRPIALSDEDKTPPFEEKLVAEK